MSSRYHGLLIYDVKCSAKIDCMGPFKGYCAGIWHLCQFPDHNKSSNLKPWLEDNWQFVTFLNQNFQIIMIAN